MTSVVINEFRADAQCVSNTFSPRFHYSIDQISSLNFQIDPNTGIISPNCNFDSKFFNTWIPVSVTGALQNNQRTTKVFYIKVIPMTQSPTFATQ